MSVISALAFGLVAGYLASLGSLALISVISGREWFTVRFIGFTLITPLFVFAWAMGPLVTLTYRYLVVPGTIGGLPSAPRS
jgi:hypothetical protein